MEAITEKDKILQMVLEDPELVQNYQYDPSEYKTLQKALYSDNYLVKTVATIIYGVISKNSEDEIYRQVYNELCEIL